MVKQIEITLTKNYTVVLNDFRLKGIINALEIAYWAAYKEQDKTKMTDYMLLLNEFKRIS